MTHSKGADKLHQACSATGTATGTFKGDSKEAQRKAARALQGVETKEKNTHKKSNKSKLPTLSATTFAKTFEMQEELRVAFLVNRLDFLSWTTRLVSQPKHIASGWHGLRLHTES